MYIIFLKNFILNGFFVYVDFKWCNKYDFAGSIVLTEGKIVISDENCRLTHFDIMMESMPLKCHAKII